MEGRATCRILAQALADRLPQGVGTEAVEMAAVVNRQTAGDPACRAPGPRFDGPAFRAAVDLVFRGRARPSGDTEPVLPARRPVDKAG